MRGSVVVKLWLAFTGLILVVLIPLEVALHRLLTDFYATQVTEPLLYHNEQVAAMLAVDPETGLTMAPMMGQMVGGKVYVVDSKGQPIPFPGQSRVPPPPEAIRTVLEGRYFVGRTEGDGAGPYIVTGVPMPHGQGAVLLLAPAAPVQQSLTVARRYLWLAGAGTLLLGTALALLLARSLLRPVIAIERATRSIARGDFSTRVEVTSQDEIGRLAAAVNRMTEQLQAFETRRREFLANVAHELRTPLSYIRGYTQAMAEGLVTAPDEVARYQRIVHEEAVRVGRLVDDLMDLAQLEEGQRDFDLLPLDLRLPVEQAAATVRPRAEEKGVALVLQVPPDLPRPLADGQRIQQVVFNLLDNALRHTPPGGQVTVTAEADPQWVTVRVADTGEGIPPDHLPLVFERFQKRQGPGRGLGLAIVRSIVRAHGGEVGAESAVGQGSTFWFRLPISPDR